MIDRGHDLPLFRQANLLQLSRSNLSRWIARQSDDIFAEVMKTMRVIATCCRK